MSKILSSIEHTIKRYQLLSDGQPIVVAFSGGKDSITLTLSLRELGITTYPVAVDMGYESSWGRRICQLGDEMGIHVDILAVRNIAQIARDASDAKQLTKRLLTLDVIGSKQLSTVSPCTHCYSSKVIALDGYCEAKGATTIAFAHHRTDAAASLLKEALFHIDHRDAPNEPLSLVRFGKLISELGNEVSQSQRLKQPQPLLDQIKRLVADGLVDTDEPPRQMLRADRAGVEVIRPLFETWESEIEASIATLPLMPEGSGCGHGATLETETPREMVHNRILRHAPREFRNVLDYLLEYRLLPNGSSTIRSRQRRRELLGEGYRGSATDLEKL